MPPNASARVFTCYLLFNLCYLLESRLPISSFPADPPKYLRYGLPQPGVALHEILPSFSAALVQPNEKGDVPVACK